MNKKIIILIVVFLILALGLVFWQLEKSENINNQTSYQDKAEYSVDDFPDFKGDKEEAERLIESLNKQYTFLNESDKPYSYWIQIGLIKKVLRDYEGAESAWRSAVSLVEQPIVAYGNLADLYFHFMQDYDKAEGYYKKVMDLSPRSFIYREGLADLYRYDLKEKDNLIEEIMLEGASQNPGDKINYYAYLFDFFTDKGNIEKKKEYEKKIKKIDPNWTLFVQEIEL